MSVTHSQTSYQCLWCRAERSVHAVVWWSYKLAQRYKVELCPNHWNLASGAAYCGTPGVAPERIPYGREVGMAHLSYGADEHACHDCGVMEGDLHNPGCDAEECPTCHRQLLSCGHERQWWPSWE